MPRSKPRKTAASEADRRFPPQSAPLRSSRRMTLAGPSQIMRVSKQSVSPVVMLDGDVLGRIKKGLSKATKSPPKSGSKAPTKKAGRKQSPARAKTAKTSPKPKKVSSPSASRQTASVKSKIPSPSKSQHAASVKTSPKPPSPKQQKTLTSSPSHSYYLRSGPVPSPAPVRLDKPKTPSPRKSVNVSRKRERSASPVNRKKAKLTDVSVKQNKSPVSRRSRIETPLKTTGKRHPDTTNKAKDTDKSSPAEKRRLLKSEGRSALNKSEVTDVILNDVKWKKVVGNALNLEKKGISVSQQNSTPLKPKLSENDVSINWNMSGIKKKLLASLTPSKMKENHATPALARTRPRKSALSPTVTDSAEKRTTRRQSVRFMINGKADTVKELKQRSYGKRLCQYLLLLGLPTAVAIASVLVYNGLV